MTPPSGSRRSTSVTRSSWASITRPRPASRIPHLHLAGTLVGVVILSAFCLGLGALSYTLALASKNQEWLFWTVQQTLLFPLLLLAGMLLPIDGGPGWLRRCPSSTRFRTW